MDGNCFPAVQSVWYFSFSKVNVMSHKDTVSRILGLSSHEWYQIAIGIQPEKLENSLLTIHKYLQHLFPQVEVRNNWMRKPNGAFSGKRPIDLILKDGELGLDAVEKYLAGAMQR